MLKYTQALPRSRRVRSPLGLEDRSKFWKHAHGIEVLREPREVQEDQVDRPPAPPVGRLYFDFVFRSRLLLGFTVLALSLKLHSLHTALHINFVTIVRI